MPTPLTPSCPRRRTRRKASTRSGRNAALNGRAVKREDILAYRYCIYEKKGRIAYVTINRPEVYNALHPPAMRELQQVWADFRDDPEVWVAIYTGAGDKAFSTGDDLKYMAEKIKEGIPQPEPFPYGGFGGITNRYECWKPIICAVNGYAIGGGFEIALACDIIVAAEHARFGLPEAKVGQMPTLGTYTLTRHMPLKQAMALLLTGDQISAPEALRLGVINEVVPREKLMAAAESWAARILECAPLSVRAIKQGAIQGRDVPLPIALNQMWWEYEQMRVSEDGKEGPAAFAEKRKPVWKGR
ncbi:MAG: enoyl-CoA hydratase/isomerase family protein [Chloroflexi bacterium]|nr:enoyl-CoA hydratase/isomerase family protein [Chloroflexota bacterium]